MTFTQQFEEMTNASMEREAIAADYAFCPLVKHPFDYFDLFCHLVESEEFAPIAPAEERRPDLETFKRWEEAKRLEEWRIKKYRAEMRRLDRELEKIREEQHKEERERKQCLLEQCRDLASKHDEEPPVGAKAYYSSWIDSKNRFIRETVYADASGRILEIKQAVTQL